MNSRFSCPSNEAIRNGAFGHAARPKLSSGSFPALTAYNQSMTLPQSSNFHNAAHLTKGHDLKVVDRAHYYHNIVNPVMTARVPSHPEHGVAGRSLHHPTRLAAALQPERLAKIKQQGEGHAIVPTTMALFGPGVQRQANDFEQAMRVMTGMAENYRGDPGNPRNHSQVLLDDKLNCSFWISGLPPDVRAKEIFDAIRGCGPVYCLHPNFEEVMAGRKKFAAAKIVFFRTEGAQRFADKTMGSGETNGEPEGLFFRGLRAWVVHNRNKVGPQRGLVNESRVVLISGDPSVVNYDYLTSYFATMFLFDYEDVIDRSRNSHCAILEFRFHSWRAQAVCAMKAIRQDRRFKGLNPPVRVQYIRDPCDVLPTAPRSTVPRTNGAKNMKALPAQAVASTLNTRNTLIPGSDNSRAVTVAPQNTQKKPTHLPKGEAPPRTPRGFRG